MIVAVRDFNFGAMENKGLNIFNSSLLLADPATATDIDLRAHRERHRPRVFPQLDRRPDHLPRLVPAVPEGGPDGLPRPEFSADMRGHAVQRIKDVRRCAPASSPRTRAAGPPGAARAI